MNPRDLENFEYIMSLTNDEFDQWMMTIGDDDINYAIELIQLRREELAMEEMNISDDVTDLSEANAVLKQFMLNK